MSIVAKNVNLPAVPQFIETISRWQQTDDGCEADMSYRVMYSTTTVLNFGLSSSSGKIKTFVDLKTVDIT